MAYNFWRRTIAVCHNPFLLLSGICHYFSESGLISCCFLHGFEFTVVLEWQPLNSWESNPFFYTNHSYRGEIGSCFLKLHLYELNAILSWYLTAAHWINVQRQKNVTIAIHPLEIQFYMPNQSQKSTVQATTSKISSPVQLYL